MQLHGIRLSCKRRFKVTTNSNHTLPIFPNLLNCESPVDKPDEVWVDDVTYIVIDEVWLFLVVMIDLFNGQVEGCFLQGYMMPNIDIDIDIDALRMAKFKRHLGKHAGALFLSN